MTRQQRPRALVAFLITLLTLGSASGYDHLLREADALIEMPCRLVSALEPDTDATCYRLNWPLDPLDYVNAFTDIEFDQTWSMNERGEFTRPFSLGSIVYEIVLTTVNDREHYLAIQPTRSATTSATGRTGHDQRPPVVDAGFFASGVVSLHGGTATVCTGVWAEPYRGRVPLCVSLPKPAAEVLQILDTLMTLYTGWEWNRPNWQYNEELQGHSRVLAVMDRYPMQGFIFMVLPHGYDTTDVVIQELVPGDD